MCASHNNSFVREGTSYEEFIRSMHLPAQLAQVDPIVASFCGGAVGVLSTLLLVEVNNAKLQAQARCVYCEVRTKPSVCILQVATHSTPVSYEFC